MIRNCLNQVRNYQRNRNDINRRCKMSGLPLEPFDSMVFIDSFQVEWIYDGTDKCWKYKGKVETIPLADFKTTGLLSKELKYMLDTIPPKGGGFAIVTKPLNRRSKSNPDGILYGNIILTSQSLNIFCEDGEGNSIDDSNCKVIAYKETDPHPPGFDINFSEVFLNSFCVEVPGGRGPRGLPGDPGANGKDGTGDGPQGETGDLGLDAPKSNTFTGIKIVDIDDVYETAVVKIDVKGDAGQIIVTKGKIKMPLNNETPAEKLIVRKLIRGVFFNQNCLNQYKLKTIACNTEEPDDADPSVLFLPAHYTPDSTLGRFQPVKGKLSDVINIIVAFYEDQLNKAANQYDQQLQDYFNQADAAARTVLDNIAQTLQTAESNNTVDLCVGATNPATPCGDGSPNDNQMPLVPQTGNRGDFRPIIESLGGNPADPRTTYTSISKPVVYAGG